MTIAFEDNVKMIIHYRRGANRPGWRALPVKVKSTLHLPTAESQKRCVAISQEVSDTKQHTASCVFLAETTFSLKNDAENPIIIPAGTACSVCRDVEETEYHVIVSSFIFSFNFEALGKYLVLLFHPDTMPINKYYDCVWSQPQEEELEKRYTSELPNVIDAEVVPTKLIKEKENK